MKPCIKCKHSKHVIIGGSHAHLICTKNKTEDGVYGKTAWQTKDLCIFVRKSCEQQNGFKHPYGSERNSLVTYGDWNVVPLAITPAKHPFMVPDLNQGGQSD